MSICRDGYRVHMLHGYIAVTGIQQPGCLTRGLADYFQWMIPRFNRVRGIHIESDIYRVCGMPNLELYILERNN